MWFKFVELRIKWGRRGYIKEFLGKSLGFLGVGYRRLWVVSLLFGRVYFILISYLFNF